MPMINHYLNRLLLELETPTQNPYQYVKTIVENDLDQYLDLPEFYKELLFHPNIKDISTLKHFIKNYQKHLVPISEPIGFINRVEQQLCQMAYFEPEGVIHPSLTI